MRLHSTVLLALLFTSGCKEQPATVLRTAGLISADISGCMVDSMWSTDLNSPARTVTHSGSDLVSVRGMIHVGRSLILFDSGYPRLTMLDDSTLQHEGSSGREGSGPGEFGVVTRYPSASTHGLADANGSLVVLDETRGRVQSFDYSGKFIRQLLPNVSDITGAAPEGRIYAHGDTVFAATSPIAFRQPESLESYHFRVVAVAGDSTWEVARVTMPALPRTNGGVMVGSEEAVPLWAIQGDCVYLNNGHDLTLYRRHRSSGIVDTLTVPDPDVELGRQFSRQTYASLGVHNWPEPSLQRRIRDLSVDPSGAIWLHLVLSDTTVDSAHIAVINRDGSSLITQAPFFPRAFASGGVVFGVLADSLGLPYVARLQPF
jgi:hypothetical protein